MSRSPRPVARKTDLQPCQAILAVHGSSMAPLLWDERFSGNLQVLHKDSAGPWGLP
jgi:hypothetical protein